MKIAALVLAVSFVFVAQAKANDLASGTEKQIIGLIEDMGPDSWEEGGIDAKILSVVFEKNLKLLSVNYESRKLGTKRPYISQEACVIQDVATIKDIIEKAPNGFVSLTDRVAEEVGNCIHY